MENKQTQLRYTVNSYASTDDEIHTTNESEIIGLVRNSKIYEVIHETGDIKPYFDIDYDTPIPFDSDTFSILAFNTYNLVFSELQKKTGIAPKIAIGESNRLEPFEGLYKYSVRYWVSNIKTTKQECGEFVKYLNTLKNEYTEQIKTHFPKFKTKNIFDESVYIRNRKMRCVNSTKPDERNRPLNLVEDFNGTMPHIKDTIIGHFYEPPQGTLKMEIRPVVKSISNPITKQIVSTSDDFENLRLISTLFNETQLNDREKWMTFTWATFN